MATRQGERPKEAKPRRDPEDVLIVADDGELYHIHPEDFQEVLSRRRVSQMPDADRRRYEQVQELLGRGVTLAYLPTSVPEAQSNVFPDVKLIGIFCYLVNLAALKQQGYYDRPKRLK